MPVLVSGCVPVPRPGRRTRRRARVITTAKTCPVPEIARLGRTLAMWRTEFLARFGCLLVGDRLRWGPGHRWGPSVGTFGPVVAVRFGASSLSLQLQGGAGCVFAYWP